MTASERGPMLNEFRELVRDFHTHVEWLAELGLSDSVPVDEAWLQARREEYRRITALMTDSDFVNAAPQTVPGSELEPDVVHVGTPTQPALIQPAPIQPALMTGPQQAAGTQATTSQPRSAQVAPQQVSATVIAKVAAASAPALSKPEALIRLQVLAEEVKSCQLCALASSRTHTVFARGTGRSGIMFIGEGPGADEDAVGLPFVGKAGQLLDRMIDAMGLERDDVYVCNVVKCRPPENRKPEDTEMAACRAYLVEQVALVEPRAIVVLGATAVQGLLGLSLGITRLRGQWRLYQGRIPVMPTFHPAYLLRQPAAKREVWQDLLAVLEQLGLKPKARGERDGA